MRIRIIQTRTNWAALGAALLSGMAWYAFLVVLILVLRFCGAHVTGIWPLR